MGIYDVAKQELVLKTAEKLKDFKELQPPAWASFAKTGVHKERPPVQKDWWHIRAAAVLHTIRKQGPIGVQKLRVKYGGRKNRGVQPDKFFKGSGNILRKILQQLEAAGLAKKEEKTLHKGRIITPQGASLLGKVSDAIMKEHNVVIPKRPEEELKITTQKKKKAKKKTAKKRKAAKKTDAKPRKRAVKKKTAKAEPVEAPKAAPKEELKAEAKPEVKEEAKPEPKAEEKKEAETPESNAPETKEE